MRVPHTQTRHRWFTRTGSLSRGQEHRKRAPPALPTVPDDPHSPYLQTAVVPHRNSYPPSPWIHLRGTLMRYPLSTRSTRGTGYSTQGRLCHRLGKEGPKPEIVSSKRHIPLLLLLTCCATRCRPAHRTKTLPRSRSVNTSTGHVARGECGRGASSCLFMLTVGPTRRLEITRNPHPSYQRRRKSLVHCIVLQQTYSSLCFPFHRARFHLCRP